MSHCNRYKLLLQWTQGIARVFLPDEYGASLRVENHRLINRFRRITTIPLIGLGLVLIACGSLGGYFWHRASELQRIALERNRLVSSLMAEKYDEAERLIDHLVERSPNDPEYQWIQASVKESLGQAEQARQVRSDLLRAGHATSALWFAENDFSLDRAASWDQSRRTEYRSLIDHAMQDRSIAVKIRAKSLLAVYHLKCGEYETAIETLAELGRYHVPANLNAAALCVR